MTSRKVDRVAFIITNYFGLKLQLLSKKLLPTRDAFMHKVAYCEQL